MGASTDFENVGSDFMVTQNLFRNAEQTTEIVIIGSPIAICSLRAAIEKEYCVESKVFQSIPDTALASFQVLQAEGDIVNDQFASLLEEEMAFEINCLQVLGTGPFNPAENSVIYALQKACEYQNSTTTNDANYLFGIVSQDEDNPKILRAKGFAVAVDRPVTHSLWIFQRLVKRGEEVASEWRAFGRRARRNSSLISSKSPPVNGASKRGLGDDSNHRATNLQHDQVSGSLPSPPLSLQTQASHPTFIDLCSPLTDSSPEYPFGLPSVTPFTQSSNQSPVQLLTPLSNFGAPQPYVRPSDLLLNPPPSQVHLQISRSTTSPATGSLLVLPPQPPPPSTPQPQIVQTSRPSPNHPQPTRARTRAVLPNLDYMTVDELMAAPYDHIRAKEVLFGENLLRVGLKYSTSEISDAISKSLGEIRKPPVSTNTIAARINSALKSKARLSGRTVEDLRREFDGGRGAVMRRMRLQAGEKRRKHAKK